MHKPIVTGDRKVGRDSLIAGCGTGAARLTAACASQGKKNEIFVDILERLTVLFNSNGYVLNATIDGAIQVLLCARACTCALPAPLIARDAATATAAAHR